MNCPHCRADNPDGARFCNQCGQKIETACPGCGQVNPPGAKFCNQCGRDLTAPPEAAAPPPQAATIPEETPEPAAESERKQATVLFADLSGYTALSENMDPEEVKEIMGRVFGRIAEVVVKYDGFVEKYVGDAVMALFGVPEAHEDDPVRAIRAAREIHDLVEALGAGLAPKIARPLAAHSGVNTGLVVTGEVDLDRGTHGVMGDTINVAARLSSLAGSGEILVGLDTCRQAEGHFTFEALEPTALKGKAEPIPVFRLVGPKEQPARTHRLRGLRAELIGRKVEMAHLRDSLQGLGQGKGAVLAVAGEAGTGKSRLIEEFKAGLDLNQVQWREGQAQAYAQNTPYYPLIDLFNEALRIEESDPPERVREKIEVGLRPLVGSGEAVIPYVGGLYALSYPEVEEASPEFWKSCLQEAILATFSALTRRGPTVICLEDLHWADPSSLDLLRFILAEARCPALFICTFRPPFSLFSSQQLSALGQTYQEIRLQDLSPSEARDMLESALKTETIPAELLRFVQDKVEGNPFYLEEIVNALIESGVLGREEGDWRLKRPISEADLPSTIRGIITARLDRLDKEAKRVLQEASVIGRAFLYEILRQASDLSERLDGLLSGLERLSLIQTRAIQPELEYVFKHALTQEVVYNGLLKKERRAIHERIGLVMEQLFQDRLADFCEALAFHFQRGRSIEKAVDYLARSGAKSLKRYSVEESHRYFGQAFELLSAKPERTRAEDTLLVDLLIEWALVFYYRGDFKTLNELLTAHQDLAESLSDKARLGMFKAWLGFCAWNAQEFWDSYEFLLQALDLGQEAGSQQVIGYACTWLAWTCPDMGAFDEAVSFGQRAQETARLFPSDHYLHFKSLGGIGYTYCYTGDWKKAHQIGAALLDYGQSHSNIRSLVLGHWIQSYNYMQQGAFQAAIESARRAVKIAADPYYSLFSKMALGMSLCMNGQFEEARGYVEEVQAVGQECGCRHIETGALFSLGMIDLASGRMSQGLSTAGEALRRIREKSGRPLEASLERNLGLVYLQIADKSASVSLSSAARNLGFVLREVPAAARKAEEYFNQAIALAREIGSRATLGQALLNLARLHRVKGRPDQARECLDQAVEAFQEIEAEDWLDQTREARESLT